VRSCRSCEKPSREWRPKSRARKNPLRRRRSSSPSRPSSKYLLLLLLYLYLNLYLHLISIRFASVHFPAQALQFYSDSHKRSEETERKKLKEVAGAIVKSAQESQRRILQLQIYLRRRVVCFDFLMA
jgi:hypothetical protein